MVSGRGGYDNSCDHCGACRECVGDLIPGSWPGSWGLARRTVGGRRATPETYPSNWVIVSDFNFNAIIDGRGVVVDTASENQPFKGMFRASQFASILAATTKPEIYTAESFFSRLSEGDRTDAITIWDKATLKSKAEILLPGGKRQQIVTYKNTFQFTNGEKWALVTNFTPAHSVTVVDLDGRKVLGEIELPGCSMVYPTGERGFTTFCADGTLTSISLDTEGKVASTTTTKPIHDIDNQAMFGMPAMVGKTAWFVTYRGIVRGIDLSGPVAKPLKKDFSVGTADGGQPEWRPGGWQVIASDLTGRLYVLMSPYGPGGRQGCGPGGLGLILQASRALLALRRALPMPHEAAPGTCRPRRQRERDL
ncbi:MAG: amine dehydrogenase [Sphingomonadales bacterium]|nr:amine dehydrogenase [Sphingomonadales bacterium]